MSNLEKKLEAYDLQGMRFHEAKKRLLKEGYSEDAIAIAVASRPFDGKKNRPKPAKPETEIFTKHPEVAREHAAVLLETHAENEHRKQQTALMRMSAPRGLHPMAMRGMVDSAHTLGIPLFWLLGVGLFIAAIMYGMSHSFGLFPLEYVGVFAHIYLVLIGLLFAISIIRTEIRYYVKHLSRQTASPLRRAAHIISLLAITAFFVWSSLRLFGA